MSNTFKGTPGDLELKYVSGICIGIGTKGQYAQMTANSILPDTDEDYEKERIEIVANMTLYSHARNMLEMLENLVYICKNESMSFEQQQQIEKAEDLITRATTI